VLILSAPLWALTVVHLKRTAVEDAASIAGASAWHLLFGRGEPIGGEVTAELSKFWAYATLLVGVTVLGQVLLMAVYDVLLNVLWGRTLGKAAFSLAVIGSDGSRPGAEQSVLRAALTIVLPGTGWALFLAGAVWLSVSLMLLGLALVVLSVVECLLLRESTCWHDRRTHTFVVPSSLYPQLYATGQQAFTQGRSLARQAYQAPQTQQAILGAQQRYQQVLDSDAAARAIELGKQLDENLKWRRPGGP
jgi:RDD family